MIYAYNAAKQSIWANKKSKGFCPQCQSPLIAKCGKIKIWHWAHPPSMDCDLWTEPETEWHLSWKQKFPVLACEQTLTFEEMTHRVDAIASSGIAIEFQHSPISCDMIRDRQDFYRHVTGGLIWVFDARDWNLIQNGQPPDDITFNEWRTHRNEKDIYRWKHPKPSIIENFGEASVSFFLDRKDGMLEILGIHSFASTFDLFGEDKSFFPTWIHCKRWMHHQFLSQYASFTVSIPKPQMEFL